MSQDNRKLLERGLLIGAALGAVYVATRPRGAPREAGSKFVDWERVEGTALRLVSRTPGGEIADRPTLNRAYREMVRQSTELITSYTGARLDGPLTAVYVFDRQDWVRANLDSFRRLFGRVEELQARLQRNPSVASLLFGEVNRTAMGLQLGVLVGYLARRVLGQYDLSLLGKEAVTSGNLYFVEPNIARLEGELSLPGDELRMWIALHETTHAYEFEGNSWLREHFNGLLEGYFEGLNAQVELLRGPKAVTRVAERLLRGERPQGWIELVMTEEQRALFQKLQGIMSLLEGYSNHIMNHVGQQTLPNFGLIKERIERRQKRNSAADRLFAKLTGLNLKLEQYRLGEIFVNAVVERKGIAFMDQVWSGAEALPVMAEIREPERWIARMEGARV